MPPSNSSRTFNLVDDPWIPVTRDGSPVEVSLAELYQTAHRITALGGDPPVVSSLTRLLTAILRDALGTGGLRKTDWDGWWENGIPAVTVTRYLEANRERLYLYGSRPFFQDSDMIGDRTGVKSVAELMPHRPTGNNAVMRDGDTQDLDVKGGRYMRLSSGEAARWLVSAQQYGRTGIYASVDAAGKGRSSGRAGLLVDRLVIIPSAPDFGRTLLLNIPTSPRPEGDLPPWRRTRAVIPGDPAGVVQLLTWQIRHILLLPEEDGTVIRVKIAADTERIDPGVKRPWLAENDPHVGWTPAEKASEGYAPVAFTPDTTGWRNGAALLAALTPARAAAWTHNRPLRGIPVCIQVCGVAVESHAKYVAWRNERFPLPLYGPGAETVLAAGKLADDTRSALTAAVYTLYKDLGRNPSSKTLNPEVSGRYWSALDYHGTELITALTALDDPTAMDRLLDGWKERCNAEARQVLRRYTNQALLIKVTSGDAVRHADNVFHKLAPALTTAEEQSSPAQTSQTAVGTDCAQPAVRQHTMEPA